MLARLALGACGSSDDNRASTTEQAAVDAAAVATTYADGVLGARRDVDDPTTARGERTFQELGCTACHRPELRTGRSDVPALSNQVIRPYTDLLLHDMGPALADGRPDGLATGSEWRTAPLWGIGLVETVNGHTRFLHDGRARSIEEAILWHGGEAAGATNRFRELPRDEREALLAFLRSL